jgi:HrpA-like RNA helicase
LSLTGHLFSHAGKSSQVPQMLLEENMFPILCTQPRRLAVVAVAKRVAQERGCLLGEEVGYHIGQLNVSTTKYTYLPHVLLLQPESPRMSMIIKM